MSNDSYNGWTNYETWCVALWLDNDYGAYCDMQDTAKSYARDDSAYEFEKYIRDYVEEQNPLADQANIFTDLLNAALSEVNWREIAEHYMSDVEPDEDDTEYWFYNVDTGKVFTAEFDHDCAYEEYGPYDSEDEAREAMLEPAQPPDTYADLPTLAFWRICFTSIHDDDLLYRDIDSWPWLDHNVYSAL